MKKLNTFEDYLFNQIFESKNKTTAIILSDRLYNLIGEIGHPIADDFYGLNNNVVIGDKATLIDYDEKELGNFTYTIPAKLGDYIEKEKPSWDGFLDSTRNLQKLGRDVPEVWVKYRSSIKIGKLISKLFPNKYKASGEPGKDMESFANEIKFQRNKAEESMKRFKIVEGDDIKKYYNQLSYDGRAQDSTLGNSCMRYSKCEDYINFYSRNDGVKLVVLMSDDGEDTIMGRALLWDIAEIEHTEVDRKFMDRIYFIYDTDILLFKEFAKRNGWLYKKTQNMNAFELIIDPLTDKEEYLNLKTVNTFEENRYYPYMDTMKYFYTSEGYLCNNDNDGNDCYFLQSTNGSYEDRSSQDDDDDDDDEDYTYCELGDESVHNDDASYIERYQCYATQRYINNHMVWSKTEDDYLKEDDAIYSDYHGTYIDVYNTMEVFKPGSSDVESMDDCIEYGNVQDVDDSIRDEFIEYIYNGGDYYFDDEDKDNFIEVISLATDDQIFIHKIWDKDKIFIYNGQKYLDNSEVKKDALIGQKRIDFNE